MARFSVSFGNYICLCCSFLFVNLCMFIVCKLLHSLSMHFRSGWSPPPRFAACFFAFASKIFNPMNIWISCRDFKANFPWFCFMSEASICRFNQGSLKIVHFCKCNFLNFSWFSNEFSILNSWKIEKILRKLYFLFSSGCPDGLDALRNPTRTWLSLDWHARQVKFSAVFLFPR